MVIDDLIAGAINARLAELQRVCAIARYHVRECRRGHYEPYEERRRHVSIRRFRAAVRHAERALAEHVAKYRPLMGDTWAPNKGRLCWSNVCGGMPLKEHYCDLPEGHDGPHSVPEGTWTDEDAARKDRRWTIHRLAQRDSARVVMTRFCWLPGGNKHER